jgi:biopolymer transport protein ExbD
MAIIIGNHDGSEDELNSMINTTPLVDVMLVLLIIFLITVPVVTQTIPVKLPIDRNQLIKEQVADINLSINKEGDIFWGQKPVANTQELLERLKKVAALNPQPEVHIRGDQNAQYEYIGKVVLTAQRAGITKVGFVLEPPGNK